MTKSLPEKFEELEPYSLVWGLETEMQRNRMRLACTMEELQSFYDIMLRYMDEVLAYLNALPLDGMPPQAARLFQMTLSMAEIAPAVELFAQPSVPDGFESARFIPADIARQVPTAEMSVSSSPPSNSAAQD